MSQSPLPFVANHRTTLPVSSTSTCSPEAEATKGETTFTTKSFNEARDLQRPTFAYHERYAVSFTMSGTATVSVDAVEKAAGASAAPARTLPVAPNFAALSARSLARTGKQTRRIPVPPNRLTPLKSHWMEIYEPIVKHLKLQIRMNLRNKAIELKTSKATEDTGALQKGADFVKGFVLGFAVQDAVALIRLDDLYIETFEVKDIRSTLKGDHLARAVGRIAGKDGRTKFTIENATKTRIVVADTKIHILGSYENTRLARRAISSLVLGAAPGKVYNRLRTVSARLNERKF